MKIKYLLLAALLLAVFVLAVAVKQTGYQILGASPVPASEIAINGRALLAGTLYYLLTLAGIHSRRSLRCLGRCGGQRACRMDRYPEGPSDGDVVAWDGCFPASVLDGVCGRPKFPD